MPELERRYRLRDDLNGDVWENEIFDTHMEAFDAANERNKRALKRHDEDGRVGDPILYSVVSVQTRARKENKQ